MQNYLNKPAGLCAQAIVRHVVIRITAAWVNTELDPMQIVQEILEVFHHPAAAHGRTGIQGEMRSLVQNWVQNLGNKKSQIMQGLSFEGTNRFSLDAHNRS